MSADAAVSSTQRVATSEFESLAALRTNHKPDANIRQATRIRQRKRTGRSLSLRMVSYLLVTAKGHGMPAR